MNPMNPLLDSQRLEFPFELLAVTATKIYLAKYGDPGPEGTFGGKEWAALEAMRFLRQCRETLTAYSHKKLPDDA